MSEQKQQAILEVIEGLLCLIAADKPSNGDRAKAISALVELRAIIESEPLQSPAR